MNSYYDCGHIHVGVVKVPDDYVEWKYSVGFRGDNSKCYPCWKQSFDNKKK